MLSPTQAPDLYLGYGASKDSPPLYSFEYPSDWEEQVVTKTDKSTMVSAEGCWLRMLHTRTANKPMNSSHLFGATNQDPGHPLPDHEGVRNTHGM